MNVVFGTFQNSISLVPNRKTLEFGNLRNVEYLKMGQLKKNNHLSTHDAISEDQFALKHWFVDVKHSTFDPKTLNFRLLQLLKNPTVDFSIDNFRALKLAAQLGNFKAVVKLIKNLDSLNVVNDKDVILNETLNRASFSQNLNLVKLLMVDYKIQPSLNTLKCAAGSGDLEITRYIREWLGIKDAGNIPFLIKHSAKMSGNNQLIEYLNSQI